MIHDYESSCIDHLVLPLCFGYRLLRHRQLVIHGVLSYALILALVLRIRLVVILDHDWYLWQGLDLIGILQNHLEYFLLLGGFGAVSSVLIVRGDSSLWSSSGRLRSASAQITSATYSSRAAIECVPAAGLHYCARLRKLDHHGLTLLLDYDVGLHGYGP